MKQIAFILSIIVLVSACNNNQDDLNKDVAAPVTVMEIQPKSIEKFVSTSGTVYPVKEASLKSELSGKYTLLKNPATGKPYALGDKVVQGAKIIALENKEFENNLKIDALKLRLEITKQVYEKQQSLYEKGGVTLSELKNAEIEFVNARYSYEDAQISLEKFYIRAPFNATIVDLPYFTPNTRVEANVMMIKLMDYSQLQMDISLAEKNFTDLKKGQKARIMNYTLPDDTLRGLILQISPAIDPETRSFKVVIGIENPRLKLHPGMFAKAEIIISLVDSTIVIPKNIIQAKQKGNVVFIINKGLAEERLLNFGIENPDEVQVVSGLSKNDRIVVKGFETLRNRSKVKEIK
jgi:membrane fusion protein, multidrug efflux system